MCEICGFQNAAEELPNPFTEADSNGLINDVWNGTVTTTVLPTAVYSKTVDNLLKGLGKGYKEVRISTEWGSPDYEMLKDLSDNIYMFSGAKTYQQVRSLTGLLTKAEYKNNFHSFKKEAKKFLDEYNEAYLKSEYNTAKGSARMAAEWNRIQADKDVLPLLQYQTVGDGRVRPEHAALDNIIRPADDKFWAELYPPNGWNCRCSVIQLAEGEVTDLRGKSKLKENVPPEFEMNVGMDKFVFKTKGKGKHPYFSVAKKDKKRAKENFGLPIPK